MDQRWRDKAQKLIRPLTGRVLFTKEDSEKLLKTIEEFQVPVASMESTIAEMAVAIYVSRKPDASEAVQLARGLYQRLISRRELNADKEIVDCWPAAGNIAAKIFASPITPTSSRKDQIEAAIDKTIEILKKVREEN